jgi:IS5 family transposase
MEGCGYAIHLDGTLLQARERLVVAHLVLDLLVGLKARGLQGRIHQRGSGNHTLLKAQEIANRQKSKVRVRAEHVFGVQHLPGGRIVRTIGVVRAKPRPVYRTSPTTSAGL